MSLNLLDKYEYSRVWKNVEKDLSNCDLSIVIHTFLMDDQFSEDFIIKNRKIFGDLLDHIVKYKRGLSDNFFIQLCDKWSYSKYRHLHKQNYLMRNFDNLDVHFGYKI